MSVRGPDHSWYDWTGEDAITGGFYYIPIQFDVSLRKGSQFAILKACDGTNDTRFYAEAMRDARAAGIPAIPYVWCHGRNWFDPRAQGEHWYNRLKDEKAIAVDFESHLDSVPNYDDLYNAVNRMRELGYKGKLILYTNWGYWLSYGSPASVWLDLFDGGLWLSDPDDDPPNPPSWASATEKQRKAPTPFPDYVIHQYSFSGDPALYGVTAPKLAIDENKFTGTTEQFESLFGGAITPPPPQESIMNKVTIIANGINVRSGADTTFPILRQLKTGNIVYTPFAAKPNAGGKIWIQITENPVEFVAVGDTLSKVEALPGGGEIKPVINFHLSAEGYPAQDVTWTPL